MFHEGAEKVLLSLDGATIATRCVGECFNVNSGEVCQGVHFQVPPYVFNGIQLWCIRWEEEGVDTALMDNGLDDLSPMRQETIPN